MKKLLITILFISVCSHLIYAQTTTTSFDVEGIKVIFKPTVKQIINVRMFYRGGVTNYPAGKAGIENLTLSAVTECGTRKYEAPLFKDKADKYGIEIGSEAEYDYGDIEMECVAKYFNEGWDLFTEAIVNPVFDDSQLQLLKNKLANQVRQEKTNPDKRVNQILVNDAFAGTPYAADPNGDEDIINGLTSAEVKAYYADLLNKNRMFIVVSGNIRREDLIEKIKSSFAALPSKPYAPAKLGEPFWTDYKTVSEIRELPTDYVSAIINAPVVQSADYVPYTLGISALGGALFAELRTRLNLSYNPGAYTLRQQMPYALMYVSTTDPKAAVTAMDMQLYNLITFGLTDKGLEQLKNSYITTNYIKQQSTSSITSNLGIAEILGGWKMAEDLPVLINNVTVKRIKEVMGSYIAGVRWSYLGNQAQFDNAASAFKKKIK